jgi:hypothetical protein
MKYNIGQVLYVLLNKETKICPVQVVEEITKKSLDGESTIYVVRAGKKNETLNLSDMDGQVFDSIDVLRKTLHDRITRTVDSVINGTLKRAQEWYPHVQEVREYQNEAESISPIEPLQLQEDTIITLPDGTVAKMRSPLQVPGM